MYPEPHAPAPPEPSEAERELSEFSYIVSHDLAASLRHVAQFSHLLTDELGANASAAQIAYRQRIQQATGRCQAMMDQLLAYSRVQQKPLALRRCDVTRVAEIAALQLSAEVREAEAEIAIEALGEHVVDSDLMATVFKHAFANAIKFHAPGVAPRVQVRRADVDDAWSVRISDNGIGVVLDRQEKMFRMFYQDHAEGAYEGSGAGLAIARRILRRHGGDARFVETGGDGACLEITLPKAPPA